MTLPSPQPCWHPRGMHGSGQAPAQFHSSRTEKENILLPRSVRAVGPAPLDPQARSEWQGWWALLPEEEEWDGHRAGTNSRRHC